MTAVYFIWCLFSFSERISCILLTGGLRIRSTIYTVEVLSRDLRSSIFPNLPAEIIDTTMFMHDGKILVCGGGYNEEKCLQLIHGTWKKHSTLNEKRIRHSTVTTQTGTFIFGGFYSDNTYEYLPKDSVKWLKGRPIIPKGFYGGCAIAVKSDQESSTQVSRFQNIWYLFH